jgi:Tol biopolymer transport system component
MNSARLRLAARFAHLMNSARLRLAARFACRLPVRHPWRVYQAIASALPALALLACGEPPPQFGDTAADGLVMVRIVDGSYEIVRVRLADAAARAITATPGIEETWPYWSEPAGRVVFLASTASGRHDLMIWDPEQAAATRLARTPLRDEQWPVWSPRRPELAFAFRGGKPPAGIAVANLASGTRSVIAAAGWKDFFLRPSFSPDGDWIVAQRRDENGRGSSLWRIQAGRAPQPLTQDPRWYDAKPAYTRDAREILFLRRPAGGGPRDILAIPPDGGATRTLASTPASDERSVLPSPRRDEIAVISDRDGRSALYLAPLPGGTLRELSPNSGRSYYSPRWSPDGERLVAISTPRSDGEPLLRETGALAETRVVVFDREGRVLFEGPGFMPDWMPPWR